MCELDENDSVSTHLLRKLQTGDVEVNNYPGRKSEEGPQENADANAVKKIIQKRRDRFKIKSKSRHGLRFYFFA